MNRESFVATANSIDLISNDYLLEVENECFIVSFFFSTRFFFVKVRSERLFGIKENIQTHVVYIHTTL